MRLSFLLFPYLPQTPATSSNGFPAVHIQILEPAADRSSTIAKLHRIHSLQFGLAPCSYCPSHLSPVSEGLQAAPAALPLQHQPHGNHPWYVPIQEPTHAWSNQFYISRFLFSEINTPLAYGWLMCCFSPPNLPQMPKRAEARNHLCRRWSTTVASSHKIDATIPSLTFQLSVFQVKVPINQQKRSDEASMQIRHGKRWDVGDGLSSCGWRIEYPYLFLLFATRNPAQNQIPTTPRRGGQ